LFSWSRTCEREAQTATSSARRMSLGQRSDDCHGSASAQRPKEQEEQQNYSLLHPTRHKNQTTSCNTTPGRRDGVTLGRQLQQFCKEEEEAERLQRGYDKYSSAQLEDRYISTRGVICKDFDNNTGSYKTQQIPTVVKNGNRKNHDPALQLRGVHDHDDIKQPYDDHLRSFPRRSSSRVEVLDESPYTQSLADKLIGRRVSDLSADPVPEEYYQENLRQDLRSTSRRRFMSNRHNENERENFDFERAGLQHLHEGSSYVESPSSYYPDNDREENLCSQHGDRSSHNPFVGDYTPKTSTYSRKDEEDHILGERAGQKYFNMHPTSGTPPTAFVSCDALRRLHECLPVPQGLSHSIFGQHGTSSASSALNVTGGGRLLRMHNVVAGTPQDKHPPPTHPLTTTALSSSATPTSSA
ncbi:unnamed protein product, partial [Amoebophrya sp. A25]